MIMNSAEGRLPMSKRYCGLIKPNLENPYEPFRTVSVEIRDEGGRREEVRPRARE